MSEEDARETPTDRDRSTDSPQWALKDLVDVATRGLSARSNGLVLKKLNTILEEVTGVRRDINQALTAASQTNAVIAGLWPLIQALKTLNEKPSDADLAAIAMLLRAVVALKPASESGSAEERPDTPSDTSPEQSSRGLEEPEQEPLPAASAIAEDDDTAARQGVGLEASATQVPNAASGGTRKTSDQICPSVTEPSSSPPQPPAPLIFGPSVVVCPELRSVSPGRDSSAKSTATHLSRPDATLRNRAPPFPSSDRPIRAAPPPVGEVTAGTATMAFSGNNPPRSHPPNTEPVQPSPPCPHPADTKSNPGRKTVVVLALVGVPMLVVGLGVGFQQFWAARFESLTGNTVEIRAEAPKGIELPTPKHTDTWKEEDGRATAVAFVEYVKIVGRDMLKRIYCPTVAPVAPDATLGKGCEFTACKPGKMDGACEWKTREDRAYLERSRGKPTVQQVTKAQVEELPRSTKGALKPGEAKAEAENKWLHGEKKLTLVRARCIPAEEGIKQSGWSHEQILHRLCHSLGCVMHDQACYFYALRECLSPEARPKTGGKPGIRTGADGPKTGVVKMRRPLRQLERKHPGRQMPESDRALDRGNGRGPHPP